MKATVPALYHPTVAVHDLEAARNWFRRVFNRKPLRWEETLDVNLLNEGYPTNYSFFAFVCDIHWVFLCPELHARGLLNGQTRYRNVQEGMIGLGWYTDNAVELFDRLAKAGIRSHDQQGQAITTAKLPTSSFLNDVFTGFTEPADTGIRYEFQQTGQRHWAKYSEEADLRLRPGWKGPSVDENDPLGLEFTSHHTIVTRDPGRLRGLYVDLLEAEQLATAKSAELDCECVFLRLADTILEVAVPNPGRSLYDRVADGEDLYLGLTYKVASAEKVVLHLSGVNVPFVRRASDTVVIEPAHGFGVEWRFVDGPLPYRIEDRRLPTFR